MARINTRCPFTHRLCTECALYRGRHYCLGFCQQYRGCIGGSTENTKSDSRHHSAGLQSLKDWVEPWAGLANQPESELDVKLKVIDMESGQTKVCDFSDTKMWDWSNPEFMRIIDGLQITSREKLVEILSFKAGKGCQEVAVYEAYRFMLHGGGSTMAATLRLEVEWSRRESWYPNGANT